jgi:hypothetical protein
LRVLSRIPLVVLGDPQGCPRHHAPPPFSCSRAPVEAWPFDGSRSGEEQPPRPPTSGPPAHSGRPWSSTEERGDMVAGGEMESSGRIRSRRGSTVTAAMEDSGGRRAPDPARPSYTSCTGTWRSYSVPQQLRLPRLLAAAPRGPRRRRIWSRRRRPW